MPPISVTLVSAWLSKGLGPQRRCPLDKGQDMGMLDTDIALPIFLIIS
jgi:hypothetical protein